MPNNVGGFPGEPQREEEEEEEEQEDVGLQKRYNNPIRGAATAASTATNVRVSAVPGLCHGDDLGTPRTSNNWTR